jgi:hypothetical protein
VAIAALVCGIVEFAMPLALPAAIICGHVALRQIRRTPQDGYGLAKAGLILGYLGLVLVVVGALFALGSAPAIPTGRP